MTKIEVFSDRFVTKKNPNGRGIIDIDTPEGVSVFGGADSVAEYKRNEKINAEVQKIAEDSLVAKEELESKLK